MSTVAKEIPESRLSSIGTHFKQLLEILPLDVHAFRMASAIVQDIDGLCALENEYKETWWMLPGYPQVVRHGGTLTSRYLGFDLGERGLDLGLLQKYVAAALKERLGNRNICVRARAFDGMTVVAGGAFVLLEGEEFDTEFGTYRLACNGHSWYVLKKVQ